MKRDPDQVGKLVLRIGAQDAGRRLDVYLARKFGRSRSSIRNRLNGKVWDAEHCPLKWSYRLRAGSEIEIETIVRPEPQVEVIYRILYQDPHIVVVDKGAGAPVHPTRSWRTRTLLTRMSQDLQDDGLGPAHRLDRETSGVVVFGRSRQSLARLMDQFKQGKVRKRYLAVVHGDPAFDQLRIDEPLGPDPDFALPCRVRVDRERGRAAVTELQVLGRYGNRSLISARPHTGRQHQIRVHLAHLGHPLLGDKLYLDQGRPYLAMIHGGLDAETFCRLGHHRHALHAQRLRINHPISGATLNLQASLPADLRALLMGKKESAIND